MPRRRHHDMRSSSRGSDQSVNCDSQVRILRLRQKRSKNLLRDLSPEGTKPEIKRSIEERGLGRGGNRTVIEMSSKVFEAGFVCLPVPNSGGSPRRQEQILVSLV
jgi:hypothetical protein